MTSMALKHIGNVDDYDIADALNAFVRNITSDDVTVEFTGGVASIRGRVASLTASRAIEDLIVAHDGVTSVLNHLVVAPLGVAPHVRPV